jgi:nitrogen fixation/metabolism regulation signal transduction histidine kinase
VRGARSWRGSLRDRLLAAFVLVGVPPVLLLAVAVTTLVSRSFDETAARRLEAGLRAVRSRITEMERRAATQVALVANQDLAATVPAEEGDLRLAETIGQKRDLPALEIVDAAGRVVSSRHWPAGYALEDRDGLFPGGEGSFRVEKVASGHGAEERLALMPAHPATWRGAPVTVRGGPFLDGEFLADLGATLSAEVGLRDEVRHRWLAPAGSPLLSWDGGPGPAARGEVALGGAPHHWAAAALGPGLSVVVALPRSDLDLARHVRGLTLAIAGAALVAALAAALWLSGRIAWPVGRVADAARRVAGGDLDGSVPVTSRDEIGDLARAFNTMTAELRASRERAVQAERVAAWREMARRLAHELKNPLFPIQLSIETLRRNLDQPAPSFASLFRESSETILDALRSLRRIVDEFAEFARMPRPEPRPTDVNAVVEKVLALHRAGAGAVRMETALSPELPAIAADPDLLARALGNLVRNALEAMPRGGTLNVRTAARDGTVSIEVEDDGPGITEEQRTRLFVPYFTTKKGGTGLGLAIVQGIVSDHGGRVEVESAPGAGTTFTLILPARHADV